MLDDILFRLDSTNPISHELLDIYRRTQWFDPVEHHESSDEDSEFERSDYEESDKEGKEEEQPLRGDSVQH